MRITGADGIHDPFGGHTGNQAGIACLFKNQGTVGTQRHDDGPSGLPAEHVDGCIEGIGTGQLEGFVPVQVKDGMKRIIVTWMK